MQNKKQRVVARALFLMYTIHLKRFMKPINKEEDLFNYLRLEVYPDLVKARGKLSRWDCYSVDKAHRIELKCRKTHYDTLLIEKKKFDAMIKVCNKHLDIPYYICSTPKGIYSFNLFDVSPKWEVNYKNPATTQFNNRNRIAKEVAYLNINDAKWTQ